MTLLEILPSLRGATTPRLDPAVWPATTHCRHGRITVGGISLDEIADRFGSPTYVIDEWSLRAARTLRGGPRDAEVLRSTSSLLSTTAARLVARHGLSLVVHSAHESAVARRAGVDPARLVLVADSADCVSAGPVGRIVVEATMSLEAIAVVATTLDVVGVRCDAWPVPDDIYEQVLTAVAVMCDAQREHQVQMAELHVGIATRGVPPGADLGIALENAIDDACIRNRIGRPHISVDFGESMTARAAVTVSRVHSVGRGIDGRPAVVLAGSAEMLPRPVRGELAAAAVVNRHPLGMTDTFSIIGVNGATEFSEVALPQNIRPGDVLALVSRDGSDLLASSNAVAVNGGDVRRMHR
ncbi:diaminopimelate decarboxylase [Antrihabitans stalactiti]|uniref:Diaminopimelate decarboxylase n=1 Tax=Antrihabitans stalactiti TaxID=2584121 RepID=A0A848K7N7_9NOCA|nr:diaminopimelate decarboxylase [Antrihabitans stalactiti]